MTPRVPIASWPEDAPSRFDNNIISISAGNSSLNWALHMGHESGFVPVLFWRTPPVLRDEQTNEDPCEVLSRHLPPQIHSLIFGSEEAEARKEIASRVAARRTSPAFAVYISSSNQEHENGIAFLFKDIPSKVVRLASFHFFAPEDGAYETIGVDRVATLFSCKDTYSNRPVLCFDAGTAWTYTGLDKQGKILGGGITPGIGARFRCMADYCDNLPDINHEIYHNALKDQFESNTPFPIFATDTSTAMISATFAEVANHARYLVKNFLKTVKDDSGAGEKPVVVVAGPDAPFINMILQKDFSGVVHSEPGNPVPREEFEVEEAKHLVHYGIGQLLVRCVPPESDDPDERFRGLLQSTRVAKRFASHLNFDGTNIFRGSVLAIKKGSRLEEDLFEVQYEDGEKEHLEFPELYDALQLYLTVGEADTGETLRANQITNAVTQMEEKSKSLKDDASKRQEKRAEEVQKAKEDADKRKQAEKASTAKRSKPKASAGGGGSAAAAAPKAKKPKTAEANADKRKTTNAGSPPKAKKPKTPDINTGNRTMYINKRVCKMFDIGGDQTAFFGIIDKLADTEGLWHVAYDDGDSEDFDEEDLKAGLGLYHTKRHEDKEFQGANTTTTTAPTAAATAAAGSSSLLDGASRGEPTAEAPGAAAADNGGT